MKDLNILNQNSNDAFRQFEGWKFITDNNLHQILSYFINFIRLYSFPHLNQITSFGNDASTANYTRTIFDRERKLEGCNIRNKYNDDLVSKLNFVYGNCSKLLSVNSSESLYAILPDFDYGRMLFDLGTKLLVSEMYSYFARRNFEFCHGILASCLVISLEKYDEKSFYEIILQHGYQLDSIFMNSVVFVCDEGGDSCYGRNMFAKMSDRYCNTSYASGHLLFARDTKHETSLWNSYSKVLIKASSDLSQNLPDYRGRNTLELVLMYASRGEYSYCGLDITQKVFDGGKMFHQYPYYFREVLNSAQLYLLLILLFFMWLFQCKITMTTLFII
ncbi:uncharacterized protein LOC113287042 [Papaver somniferum]|uniref:uncharacterized protein LOC113287042 n=1 Tax=Papaver somniferum TaxID=3469 RepID=UPI000E6FF775|nr:uncharacterized protein LOC113287042 [Papaver somniferum]XP_026391487.1 uncharacterized protein LOC113287042 [Papaver somniferum]XP_026391488.1 uncharacterized protein LOC113287042 [Papaver somniferum]XP_026391489.1 uncharacterized protein LOC113287042 [Papaver somniferum]XP_026391490.1 uncharacterized protein LOC113287042 [Papaver somniferum]XP_026391491.1 uncharacterized protein LOC113287042 [Papaver somniferum]XP_026391492.1 uncharacterized protein LOC113287042 [Papaver somniferum]